MTHWLAEHSFTRPRTPEAPPEAKAGVMLPPELFDLPGSPYRTASAGSIRLWRAYQAYTLAYACMLYRATKLAEAMPWLVDETADGDEWLTGDHPLGAVLRAPNDDMDMADLLELTSLYLDTAGVCVWLKTRDRAGRVARLYPYHRDEVRIEPADGRLYGRFSLTTQQGSLIVPASEVVLFRTANPADLSTGLGALDVALAHLNIGVDLRNAIQSSLRNAIRPGAKVETQAPFATQEEFERFRQNLQGQNGGIENTGKLVIVAGGKLDLIKSTLADLDLGPVQSDVEAAICQAFQVHPALAMARIGVENNTGFADTLEPATDLFYDTVGFPRWRRIERALTRQLLVEVDDTPDRRIAFDTSKVRALQADMGERTTEARQGAGYWTVDEARVHTGQTPFGDERGEAMLTLTRSGGRRAEDGAEPDPPPDGGTKAMTPHAAQRLIDRATRESEEMLLELAAKAALDADAMAVHRVLTVTKASGNGNGRGRPKDDDEPALTPAEAERIRRDAGRAIDEGAAHWKERLDEPLRQVARHGAEQLHAVHQLAWNVLQPGVLEFVARESADLITHVAETTKDTVRRALAASLEAGEGIRGLTSRLTASGVFGRDRAKLIAITETTRARNGAALFSMRMYAEQTPGIAVTKEWLNSGDSKVREAHQDQPVGVGRERVPVDRLFSNGLAAPGEPNCRCTLLYDVTPEG
jgi:phage portal protein BeeE